MRGSGNRDRTLNGRIGRGSRRPALRLGSGGKCHRLEGRISPGALPYLRLSGPARRRRGCPHAPSRRSFRRPAYRAPSLANVRGVPDRGSFLFSRKTAAFPPGNPRLSVPEFADGSDRRRYDLLAVPRLLHKRIQESLKRLDRRVCRMFLPVAICGTTPHEDCGPFQIPVRL